MQYGLAANNAYSQCQIRMLLPHNLWPILSRTLQLPYPTSTSPKHESSPYSYTLLIAIDVIHILLFLSLVQ
jgi:hypothetical protein